MHLKILLDGKVIEEYKNLPDTQYKFTVEARHNQILTLIVDGKKPFDTKVDDENRIVEDKFIKVNRVVVNHIMVPDWILESCFFEFENQQGQISTSNYFGQNGTTQIRFGDSLLKFFLRLYCR